MTDNVQAILELRSRSSGSCVLRDHVIAICKHYIFKTAHMRQLVAG